MSEFPRTYPRQPGSKPQCVSQVCTGEPMSTPFSSRSMGYVRTGEPTPTSFTPRRGAGLASQIVRDRGRAGQARRHGEFLRPAGGPRSQGGRCRRCCAVPVAEPVLAHALWIAKGKHQCRTHRLVGDLRRLSSSWASKAPVNYPTASVASPAKVAPRVRRLCELWEREAIDLRDVAKLDSRFADRPTRYRVGLELPRGAYPVGEIKTLPGVVVL